MEMFMQNKKDKMKCLSKTKFKTYCTNKGNNEFVILT